MWILICQVWDGSHHATFLISLLLVLMLLVQGHNLENEGIKVLPKFDILRQALKLQSIRIP